ncbi:hypothetical protein L7F22_060627 [Adiantum nelumboides]|nr:hypothetical protein [Adiantum nelumboides]
MVPDAIVHDVQIEGLDPGHWKQEATMDVNEEQTPFARMDKSMEQSQSTAKKQTAATKDKGKADYVSTKKQSIAKERRQKLADGDTSTFRDHWAVHELWVLADAKLKLDNLMIEAKGKSVVLSLDERWRKVSSWCKDEKVNKSPLQCRDKWENTFSKYKKIRDWDKVVPSGKNSFELMLVDERLEGGFPTTFDMNIYEILESRFGSDVLVNPGPILVDTSSEMLDNVNMGSTSGASLSPPPGMQSNTSTHEATPSVPSSTGKSRSQVENRRTSVQMEFQDANKAMMENMEHTRKEWSDQQQRQADAEQRRMDEMLSLQARQVQATETQLHNIQRSMDTFNDFLRAMLTRQALPP